MGIESLITNKEFMDEFIDAANKSLDKWETYEDIYFIYKDIKKLSDDDIYDLIYYCEDNGLLKP